MNSIESLVGLLSPGLAFFIMEGEESSFGQRSKVSDRASPRRDNYRQRGSRITSTAKDGWPARLTTPFLGRLQRRRTQEEPLQPNPSGPWVLRVLRVLRVISPTWHANLTTRAGVERALSSTVRNLKPSRDFVFCLDEERRRLAR